MLIFTSTADAEVKTYNGTGEYIMSEFETLDIAKQRAKQKAERHTQEQAGVYVSSYTKVKNAQVSEDEIITITSGIMNVVDVDYEVTPLDKGKSIHIVAKIKANIDTDDINKWLAKGIEERSNLAAQNKELQKAIAEQDKQIAELKKQLDDVKTQQDKDRITQEFANEDKIFLSNKKVEEAEKFWRKGDVNGAITRYTEALELNPNNVDIYIQRGLVYHIGLRNQNKALEDYNRAIVKYTELIKLNPNDENLYIDRGQIYVGFFHNKLQAMSDFNEAIRINPYNARAYEIRGNFTFNEDNLKSYNDYFKAIELEPNVEKYYDNVAPQYSIIYEIGLSKYPLEYIDYRISKLSDIIHMYPKNKFAYRARAQLYTRLQKYDLALNDYNKIIQFYPQDYESYEYRAKFYEYFKDYTKAINDYNKMISLNPNDISVYNIRIELYEKLKLYDKAIEDYATIIKFEPNEYEGYKKRGYLYKKIGKYDKATIDFKMAIEIINNPQYLQEYGDRGLLYQELKEYQKAIEDFTKAIEIDHSAFQNMWYDCRGECYQAIGEYEKAQADFAKGKKYKM